MHGHVASLSNVFPIGKELAHKILQCKPAMLENTSLSVLRKHHVFRSQR